MQLLTVRIYGIVTGLFGIIGLFVSNAIFGVFNTDIATDVLRLLVAAYLLYVGFVININALARLALLVVGVFYMCLGLFALVSPTLLGIAPNGYSGFDVGIHLIVGILALIIASLNNDADYQVSA